MKKKYIIDLNPDCVEGEYLRIPARIAGEEQWLVTKAALTPYTEPDFERVRLEAEQLGMVLAWDAARKIEFGTNKGGVPTDVMAEIFGTPVPNKVLMNFTASEAIEKIRQYEQKQEEIKVGDEVKAFEKKPFIVTGFGYGDDEEDVYCHGFVTENGISTSAKKSSCVKTGRHFHDIDEIFKEMREPGRQPAAGGVAP